MNISIYHATVPVMIHMLGNMSEFLKKAEAHCQESEIDPAALIGFRLYPDMLPFKNQVYIATDVAKGFAARMAGLEVPTFEDTEATFPDLIGRVGKTVAILESVKPEQVDGKEDTAIRLDLRVATLEYSGLDYINYFLLPNFYFHMTTAYNMLRHNGVELGKRHFLGKPDSVKVEKTK